MIGELAQWLGCFTGLLGAFLLALNLPLSRWGFLAYFLSNLSWIVYGLLAGLPALVLMQVGFLVTTFIGFYRWFHLPARTGDVTRPLRS